MPETSAKKLQKWQASEKSETSHKLVKKNWQELTN